MKSKKLAEEIIENQETPWADFTPEELTNLAEDFLAALECVEFYADKDTWKGQDETVGGPEQPDVEYIHPALDDEGKMAREVLETINAE